MPRQMSYDRVCCPRAQMACHALHCPAVCDVHWLREHPTRDVIRPCEFSKVHDGMPRVTSSYHVYNIRDMMECDAQRHPTMCAVQGP
uniref:Uncharacterized protein n=1 Tax=Solanum lycopersicum TaxID=4081 RepID=A0A3Q7EUY6_SOLLC